MKFNELTTKHKQSPKRVGRGIAAGQGKTAGRGTKGYGSRTGSKAKPGFAGGQNPIMQALPKLPGFRSHRIKMEYVTTGELNSVKAKTIDGHALAEAGLVSSAFVRIKLLHKGELTKAVTVQLQGISANALEAVQKAGGTATVVPQIGRPARDESADKNEEGKSTRGAARATRVAARKTAPKK